MSWRLGEHAARIPLVEDTVLDLLRQHFGELAAVTLSPHVSPGVELAARRTHAARLPPGTRILAVYDAPPGSGPPEGPLARGATGASPSGARPLLVHHGFVVTSERLCWKNVGEPASSIAWVDLDPDRLALDGSRLCIGDDDVVVTDACVLDACVNAFHVLALSGSHTHADARTPRDERATVPEGLRRAADAETAPCPDARAAAHGDDSPTTEPARLETASFVDYATHVREQAPEYSCWHCMTPLYETSPECAFCGVAPTDVGWLRTA